VLPPGEYDRRYRQNDVVFCQITLAVVCDSCMQTDHNHESSTRKMAVTCCD